MNRATLLHFFCVIALVSAFLTGFYSGMAHASKTVSTMEEANNALMLKRMNRQAILWRNVMESSRDGVLEPEIGREQLEKYRATLLDAKH